MIKGVGEKCFLPIYVKSRIDRARRKSIIPLSLENSNRGVFLIRKNGVNPGSATQTMYSNTYFEVIHNDDPADMTQGSA